MEDLAGEKEVKHGKKFASRVSEESQFIRKRYYGMKRGGHAGNAVASGSNNNKTGPKKKYGVGKIEDEFKNLDEFREHWEEQKKIYGMQCPITNETMTTIIPNREGMSHKYHNQPKNRLPLNASTERLLPKIGYTKKNTIFTTVEWNIMKGPMNWSSIRKYFKKEIADRYFKILKKRFGR